MIQPVKNLHGLSPIEDWIQHSQWLEQERDKYRDACERLIGHYGEMDFKISGRYDTAGDEVGLFARQVKAEIEGGA